MNFIDPSIAKDFGSQFAQGIVGGMAASVDPAALAGNFSSIATNVIKNLDLSDIFGAAANQTNQGLGGFINGINTGKLGTDISNQIDNFFKNINTAKMTGTAGGKINEGVNSFMDGADIPDIMDRLGKEAEQGLKQGSRGLGKGARAAATNVLGQVAQGVTLEVLPWVAAGIMLITAAPLFMYYLYYRAKHYIGSPKLATEVRQRTIFTPLTESVNDVASWAMKSGSKPVFNAEITRRITNITRATNNIRRNGGYFQNVLFYGPGGTGKTLISEFIAKNSGMSYVKMSGGDLAQYIKRGEHVTELNKLLDKMNHSWRPWSTRPWILFIDEAESLCRDRSKIPTAELLELQNAFLNRTGTQSTRFMIILATNRMEDLDEAVLSRMDHKIYIGPPAEPERVEIIKSYAPKFFTASEQAAFFKAPQTAQMGKVTKGLTGRALFKLLNDVANKKAATADQKLTQEMIDITVKDMMLQEQEVEERRAQKEGKIIQDAGTPRDQPRFLPVSRPGIFSR